MSSKINITLYHMIGCGHCNDFKAEWDNLKKILNDETKYKNYSHNEYEAREPEAQKATINGGELKGFPTIKITLEKGKNKKEIDYIGKRRAMEILDFIEEQINNL